MKDKQTRAAIIQWMIPTFVLLVVIIAMFIDFYITSSESAQEQVDKNFIATAESYAGMINERLISVQKSGKVVAEIMGNHTWQENEIAEEAVAALHNQTDAYMIIMSDMEGSGVNQDKEWLSLARLDYFEQIKGGEEQFLYLEDDGFNNKKTILCVLPVCKEGKESEEPQGMLLLYYPIEEFDTFIKKGEFEGNVFYSMINTEGVIMEDAQGGGASLDTENIWDVVDNGTTKSIIKRRMTNRINGVSNGMERGVGYRLAYSPIGINDWYVMIGIKQDYVDFIQSKSWDNTRSMFVKLSVCIFIFLVSIIVLNITGKLRSNRKNRELEDKADTDLLTNLNNKLATERKIKEYIAEHPNEQALLFVLDIDNFKKINDTMGHAFGDEVLRTLGHQIRAEFRVSDIIGRTGGDEFMLFLKNIKDDTTLRHEADRVARFFSNFQAGEYVKYSATASIGGAVFPRDASDFESLYKAADKALYTAKRRGKNQLALYGDDK